MKKKYLVLLTLIAGALVFLLFSSTAIPTIQPTKGGDEIYPITQFNERITKKPFGIYITPQSSPIQPERFRGFHTGVDVEYEDVDTQIPVFSVCDGEIVLSEWVTGYGGTTVLKCQISSVDYYLIYGHLKESSITKNKNVLKGDQIAVLGKGKTQETDFERQHLHFSIHKNSIDLRGYAQNQEELKEWVNPQAPNLFR